MTNYDYIRQEMARRASVATPTMGRLRMMRDYWVMRYPIFRDNKLVRAGNGMDLSRSVMNPKSRLNKVLAYLRQYGPRTRDQILDDVFDRKGRKGYAAAFFTLMQNYGYIRKVRVGNRVTYEVV